MHSSVEQSPPRRFLLALALISAAILGFEVGLTRLFSVLLRYHFAFLVICIALCGLGIGGFGAHWWKRSGRKISLPRLAMWLALSMALTIALMLRVVFAFVPEHYWLSAVLMLVPFTLGGVFLAEVFARYPQHSGRLYAWDLAGAALAAFGIVTLLQLVGAINASLAMAVLSLVGGWCAIPVANRKASQTALLATVACSILWLVNWRTTALDIPAIPPKFDADGLSLADRGVTQPLYTELGTPGHTSKIVETRWNAFARTDVVYDTELPNSYYVYTNGNVPTNMMEWNGDKNTILPLIRHFPLMDWVYANAPLGPKSTQKPQPGQAGRGSVFSIGPGGGLDALAAIHYGAARFDGAEINPSIVGLMHDYRKYNGAIYEQPGINVVTADGRAAIREASQEGKRYALVYSALTKTATAGQGMALLESFIYTEDAFRDYWNALDADGHIAIVTDQAPLVARLFTTALTMMRKQGIDPKTACQQIAIAADPNPGPYQFAIIVSKKPFSPQQTYDLSATTQSSNVTGVWIPGRAALTSLGPYPDIASGKMSLENFISWWLSSPLLPVPVDVSPRPDDRPFVLDLTTTQPAIFWQLALFALVLGLGLGLFSWKFPSEETGVSSEAEASGPSPLRSTYWQSLTAVYFTLLGVGFMLVEIPLAQKLILPLGYPTLSLTVILFSLLLGGGIGAALSQRQSHERLARYTALCALGVAIFTGIVVSQLPALDHLLLTLPLVARCALAGTVMLPLGILLGSPFPGGMRLFSSVFAGRTPILWGLNGVASVVGSLGAALGAKIFGFTVTLLFGAAIYVVVVILLFVAFRQTTEPALATPLHDEISDNELASAVITSQ